jgi:hypothetical protein
MYQYTIYTRGGGRHNKFAQGTEYSGAGPASKNLTVQSAMFPHRNIHKFTWTSPDGKTHNHIDRILIGSRWHSIVLDVRSFRGAECDASKEVDLEVNTEKTKYMLLSRHQNAGQNDDIKIAKRSFENVAQFKYYGTTVTNQNLIREEIKRRLSSGNAC